MKNTFLHMNKQKILYYLPDALLCVIYFVFTLSIFNWWISLIVAVSITALRLFFESAMRKVKVVEEK
jgi:hypothetical protein